MGLKDPLKEESCEPFGGTGLMLKEKEKESISRLHDRLDLKPYVA